MIPGQYFKNRFSYTPPRFAQASGSLILLGQGAESHQGLCLTTNISSHVQAAGSPGQGGKIEICHANYQDKVSLNISRLEPIQPPHWSAPFQEVLEQLKKHGVPLRAGQITIESSIPASDWMGGQAAALVAFNLLYRELYPYALTDTGSTSPPQRDANGGLPPSDKTEKMALANMCREVTRNLIPMADHLAYSSTSLFGLPWQALEIDLQTRAIEPVPLSADHVLIIAIPRLDHRPSPPDFHGLSKSITHATGVNSLRSFDAKSLKTHGKKLTAEECAYAMHVVRENQRVLHASQALRDGDFPQFGQYLIQSHKSARDNMNLSLPELDRLVAVAQSHKACLGSRFVGGHQGTATLHLVARDQMDDFIHHLQSRYSVRPGDFVKPIPFNCTP